MNAGAPRRQVVVPRPPHSASSMPPPISGLPLYTPRDGGGGVRDERAATPTPSELSESTGVGVEDVTTSSQMGEPPNSSIIIVLVDLLLFTESCSVFAQGQLSQR